MVGDVVFEVRSKVCASCSRPRRLSPVRAGRRALHLRGRSRDAEQKTLGGWLRFAVGDLRYNAQTRSAEAKAAVAAQVERLEARLSVDGPFAVRVDRTPRRRPPDGDAAGAAAVWAVGAAAADDDERRGGARREEGRVMCGAGISVSAGIPDFRSPGTGLYDNLAKYNLPTPQSVFDKEYFLERPDAFYLLCRELWPDNYAPTPAHHFVALLHEKGILRRCFTQNIDSLEAAAGLPPAQIVAAHGNFDGAHAAHRFDGGGDGGPVDVDALRDAIMAARRPRRLARVQQSARRAREAEHHLLRRGAAEAAGRARAARPAGGVSSS